MNVLKITSKMLRIETFITCLGGVFMIMNVLEVKPISLVGFLLLAGSALLLFLMDARMIRVKKELSRTEGLQITFILFFLGLFLLFSPFEVLQRTRLDSFNLLSLLLGMALLLINSFILVALFLLGRSNKAR